jgi:hypothetical protein
MENNGSVRSSVQDKLSIKHGMTEQDQLLKGQGQRRQQLGKSPIGDVWRVTTLNREGDFI